MAIKKRKKEHLQIIQKFNTASNLSAGFDDVILMPKSLPEDTIDNIDTGCSFLGKKLGAPILISSMTGGTEEACEINAMFARVANKYNIALSVGSQKAMIKFPSLSYTYEIRKYAPDILLIGNIGIDYLLSNDYNIDKLKEAIKKIGADAVFIHINPLQELVQLEGAKDFRGAISKISEVCHNLKIPVLIKEVGYGIDPNTAKKLKNAGVYAIDVAGSGGTSWATVEGYRGARSGETFRDWGIPTVLDLLALKKVVKLPLISSGGLKTGADAAKSIVVGAELAGFAKKLLDGAMTGEVHLDWEVNKIISELKTTMLLVGAKNVKHLQNTKYLLKGDLKVLRDQL